MRKREEIMINLVQRRNTDQDFKAKLPSLEMTLIRMIFLRCSLEAQEVGALMICLLEWDKEQMEDSSNIAT
jgi:hypothetical protein